MADKLRVDAHVGNKSYTNAAVVIIGAGISGMCMAIDLIKRNNCYNFVIVEKSSGVGGTWHDNKYPGCCCDVASILYSYSFEQYPKWSREYPGQEELLKHIRFNSEVKEAQWDEAEMKWKASVEVSGDKDSQYARSYVLTSDFLVSAVGQLNTYNCENKRIAIIGNGATSAQIVPEVANTASYLAVYQRTPNWVIPRLDADVSPLQQALLTYVPPLRMRKRCLAMDFRESFYDAVSDSESYFAQQIRNWCFDGMRTQLAHKPELWEKLSPNYAPGCKRLIVSDDYYPAIGRENVDLETRRISRITETGIEVEDSTSQEYDFIILATGFKTVEFMYPIRIRGSGGRSLSDIWKEGASAYHGVTVEDLPNFGMLYGPNTNLVGHNSIILMIEAQSRYLNALVGEVLRARLQGKTLAIKPHPNALQVYNRELQEVLARSSFADINCSSWYKTEEGKITNNWSGTVVDYQRNLSQVRWSDYVVEGSAKDAVKPRKITHLGRVREESYVSNRFIALTAASVLAVVSGVLLRGSSLLRSR
ncbi:flavin-containing monooxygenase [Aspergillus lucknowensis]|uniref:FAD/NAD(P)-binding domain-containing protein n=1 Tax=Aspergillus lucknowensis TaxID=176173 RepID=A0ABR4M0X2_9EURO